MYSFSYLEPVCCSMSSSNCCFLTCTQVSQEADQVVWYSLPFPIFTHIELGDQQQLSVYLPWAEGLFPPPSKRVCMHPSALETVIAVGLTECRMIHTYKENKKAHFKSIREKYIPKDMPSTGYEVSLFLCKEMFLSRTTLLCDQAGVQALCLLECLSQQISITKSISKDSYFAKRK